MSDAIKSRIFLASKTVILCELEVVDLRSGLKAVNPIFHHHQDISIDYLFIYLKSPYEL